MQRFPAPPGGSGDKPRSGASFLNINWRQLPRIDCSPERDHSDGRRHTITPAAPQHDPWTVQRSLCSQQALFWKSKRQSPAFLEPAPDVSRAEDWWMSKHQYLKTCKTQQLTIFHKVSQKPPWSTEYTTEQKPPQAIKNKKSDSEGQRGAGQVSK